MLWMYCVKENWVSKVYFKKDLFFCWLNLSMMVFCVTGLIKVWYNWWIDPTDMSVFKEWCILWMFSIKLHPLIDNKEQTSINYALFSSNFPTLHCVKNNTEAKQIANLIKRHNRYIVVVFRIISKATWGPSFFLINFWLLRALILFRLMLVRINDAFIIW